MLYDKIDEALDSIFDRHSDSSDVYSIMYDLVDEEYPDILELFETLHFDINIMHHTEGPNYIGAEYSFYIPDELEKLFKEKYPEELI